MANTPKDIRAAWQVTGAAVAFVALAIVAHVAPIWITTALDLIAGFAALLFLVAMLELVGNRRDL